MQKRWSRGFPNPGWRNGDVVLTRGTVAGTGAAVARDTGTVLWTKTVKGSPNVIVGTFDNVIVATSEDNSMQEHKEGIWAIDALTGATLPADWHPPRPSGFWNAVKDHLTSQSSVFPVRVGDRWVALSNGKVMTFHNGRLALADHAPPEREWRSNREVAREITHTGHVALGDGQVLYQGDPADYDGIGWVGMPVSLHVSVRAKDGATVWACDIAKETGLRTPCFYTMMFNQSRLFALISESDEHSIINERWIDNGCFYRLLGIELWSGTITYNDRVFEDRVFRCRLQDIDETTLVLSSFAERHRKFQVSSFALS